MPDPAIYSDYRAAKSGAGALANAIGATLTQYHGKPRVILRGRTWDFATWLECWSWLHGIRADQIGVRR